MRQRAVDSSRGLPILHREAGEANNRVQRESDSAYNLGKSGDHPKARQAHDNLAAFHYHQSSEPHEFQEGARVLARSNLRAAYLHHASTHDLGSPAWIASNKAFKTSTEVEEPTNIHEDLGPRGESRRHRKAAEAHRVAAVLHRKEGDEEAADRHSLMSELHLLSMHHYRH